MKIPIQCGKQNIEVRIPDSMTVFVPVPDEQNLPDDEARILGDAIDRSGGETLGSFLADARRLLVVVNDGFRPTPTARILDMISERLDPVNPTFLVATGTHRLPTESELRFLFGARWDAFRERIRIHDSRIESGWVRLGKTRRGTEVLVNPVWTEADRVLVIGSVEPHYFAGFTGGRKALLPGSSSRLTVEQNHSLAMDKRAGVFILEGNPVHEDMEEALGFIQEQSVFSLQTVLGLDGRIVHAEAGDLVGSFHRAAAVAQKVFGIPIGQKSDVVIARALPPLDKNFYQAQKAVEHSKSALVTGGILILVADCPEGIGPEPFKHLLLDFHAGSKPVLHAEPYSLGAHKIDRLADLLSWAELWVVSGQNLGIPPSTRIRCFQSLQQAVDEAVQAKPAGSMAVFLSASTTVPFLLTLDSENRTLIPKPS
jgi:nickel-dependent lactate racemase